MGRKKVSEDQKVVPVTIHTNKYKVDAVGQDLLKEKLVAEVDRQYLKVKTGRLQQGAVISQFSVGDIVNYSNGLIFKIVKINEKCGTCYDSRGMWYALSNCVKVS